MSHHPRDYSAFSTWVDVLRHQAARNSKKAAYTFLSDGSEVECQLTYEELEIRVRAVASRLQALGVVGERALLLYPPGLEYIVAFLGCLYAGVTAVPAYPPQSSRAKRSLPRLQSIVVDAQPKVVLTLYSLVENGQALLSQIPGTNMRHWLATDLLLSDAGEGWTEPDIGPETLAFLQYTSGSTSLPKGVMITHRNLLQNERVINQAFEHTEESVVAGWLPLYHDMGLIGNVLQPLYRGISCILMPPVAFLQNPIKWLSTISRYQVTTSGAPNFAYDLCVQKIAPPDRLNLDLTSWQVAFNGAEPIRHETLERFVAAFGPAGFRREAFYPCYGLAEATLIVSGGKQKLPPIVRSFRADVLEQDQTAVPASAGDKVRTLVGCGQNLEGQSIAIVDPETLAELPPGKIGEIWVSGPSVAKGYWGRAEQTRFVFEAYTAEQKQGPYLRTGDLGFLCEGELFVTGRLKDLIIIRGRNHYPQDIELTVEKAHLALRAGCGAAFAVEIAGEERLVMVQEVERQHRHTDLEAVTAAIRQAIVEQHELQAYAVVLIKPGGILKTSSGKIQRYACRQSFLQNNLDVLNADVVGETSVAGKEEFVDPKMILSGTVVERRPRLESYLVSQAARILKMEAARLSLEKSLNSSGLDSLMAIELASRIETDLGINLPMVQIVEAANLAELTTVILRQIAEREKTRPAAKGSGQIGPQIPESAGNETTPPAPGLNNPDQKIFPASSEQESLWLLHQAKADSSRAYNILVPVRLRGELQIQALRDSINEIIQRHEILRTTYSMREGRLVQAIAGTLAWELPLDDLGQVPEAERETELRRRAVEQAQLAFDLERGPVVRSSLYRLSDGEHVLALVMPHIVCDGWSIPILLQELTALYQAFSTSMASPFENMPMQYAGFLQGQQQNRPINWDVQKEYWRQNLGGHLPELILPTDWPRTAMPSISSSHVKTVIPASMTQALKAFSQGQEVTLFTTLLAAFKVLLSRYTGQEDLVVGSSVANRNCADAQGIIGPFTNAVALRTRLEGNPDFRQILARVRQAALGAFTHQDLPFDLVLRELELSRKPGRTSPFDVVFLLQNFLVPDWEMSGLAARLEEFDARMSNFDLALIIYPRAGELIASLKYKDDLFEPETIRDLGKSYAAILEQIIKAPDTRLDAFKIGDWLKEKAAAARTRDQRQTIAIAATFTADLLEPSLSFWMQELDIPAQIEFVPYNQVFQQLLDSGSIFAKNQTGINVILVRLVDWQRHLKPSENKISREAAIRHNAEELILALKTAASRSTVPHFVCICPSTSGELVDMDEAALFQAVEVQLARELENLKGVYLMGSQELANLYPVSSIFDEATNELGHIPFSPPFFTAMGTVIARKFRACRVPPYKVVVLDCDQTIWKGVCGEDGALGVEIDPPRKALQEFMVAQQAAGMLICLCSKNNESDVLEVFERRPDMPLKLEHIAARKINWQPKSKNLEALAQELNLGLDSFIFVDDNAIECAEVQAACPGVLTLQLPEQAEDIPRFLQHAWSFDHLKVTMEDKQRTTLYQQNIKREQVREKSLSLEDFLSALDLWCEVREMKSHDVARAAQLTLRTNQFNTTGIRRSEAELEALNRSADSKCFVVEARDRFGDYGMVGLMVASRTESALRVDSFLLSCRALGKRIEHQMLSYLGEWGVKHRLNQVEIEFVDTAKNQPAANFFEAIAGDYGAASKKGYCYTLPVAVAAATRHKPVQSESSSSREILQPKHLPVTDRRAGSETIMRIAMQLRDVAEIDQAVTLRRQFLVPTVEGYAEAETPTEKMLVEIWCEVLRLERVGIHDNFFKLGGHSLLGTVLISRIRKVFNVELPLHLILEQPTVMQLAVIIEQELIGQLDAEQMAAAVEELGGLSDAEISALLASEAMPSKK